MALSHLAGVPAGSIVDFWMAYSRRTSDNIIQAFKLHWPCAVYNMKFAPSRSYFFHPDILPIWDGESDLTEETVKT